MFRKIDTSQYYFLLGSWTMNDIGKFLIDENFIYNSGVTPLTIFAAMYWSTSNNCFLTTPSTEIQNLAICKPGAVYDSTQNKCLIGQESLLHFVGGDPSTLCFQFISGSYSTILSVEAWILPEFPGGDQYIYSHYGWVDFGITNTSLLAFLTCNQGRYELYSNNQALVWKHVTYRLYTYNTWRFTVILEDIYIRCQKD